MYENFSKSSCFVERSGHRSKKGITRSSNASRFRTTQDKRPIPLAVRLDVATIQPPSDDFKYLSPLAVLAYVKFRHQLKTDAAYWIALHRDREASFSVNVP